MMKLKAMMQYEMYVSFKAIGIYYAIFYGVIIAGSVIGFLMLGNTSDVVFNGIEIGSIITLFIISFRTISDDFKMFIQNGFTRKSIYFAIIGILLILALTMASVDVMIGIVLDTSGFTMSWVQMIYQHLSFFQIWLVLISFYFMITMLTVFLAAIYNRLGKKKFRMGMVGVTTFLFIILPNLCINLLPIEVLNHITRILMMFMGFMEGGHVQSSYAVLTFSCVGIVLGTLVYFLIKKVEVK